MELRCQLHNPAALDCVWNMMAHAQKTRFRLSAKLTSPFKSARASIQSTTGNRGVRISGSNAGYTMFRGSVKSTGYPLHSPVSPSLPVSCVTVCHHISAGVYNWINTSVIHRIGRLCPKTCLGVLEKKKQYCGLSEFKYRTFLGTKPIRLLSLLRKQSKAENRTSALAIICLRYSDFIYSSSFEW